MTLRLVESVSPEVEELREKISYLKTENERLRLEIESVNTTLKIILQISDREDWK